MKRLGPIWIVLALIMVLAAPVIAGDGNIEVLGSAEVRMPVPSLDWELAASRQLPNCPEVKLAAYEAADGSTKDDDGYPLFAYFKGDRDTPFAAIQVNTKDGNSFVAFWYDEDGDGVADAHSRDLAEFRAWAAENHDGDVCEIVKEVE